MKALMPDGIHLRVGLLRRPVRIPLDDVRTLEDRTLVDRRGRRFRLPASLAAEVHAALAPWAVAGSLAAQAEAVGRRLASPHAPPQAAAALLDVAAHLGATDLHLEPGPDQAVLRLRLAGALVPLCPVEHAVGRRLVAALKGMAGCLPYRTDVVQEGRIAREGVAADVRVSFVPTPFGERTALRLFGRLFRLGELGLPIEVRQDFESLLDGDNGLLLVAGATGAGKTTTLYAALAHLAARRTGAHLSVEDPVEQRLRLAGIPVDQVEIEPARGLTGEAILVAALRQDVDVVCVGEIRTPAEAALAVKAARTGRLVLAGIHAGSGEEARQRLGDLGVDAGERDRVLRGILHQRLVATRCACGEAPDCGLCHGLGRTRRLEATLTMTPGQQEAAA